MVLVFIFALGLQIIAWLMSGVRVGIRKGSFFRIFTNINNLKVRRILLISGVLLMTIYCLYFSDYIFLFGQYLLVPILWYRIALVPQKS